MYITAAIIFAIVGAVSAAAGVGKLRRAERLEAARTEFDIGRTLWTVIGLLEIAAAIGLITGIVWAPIGIAAAAGLVLLFLGAIGYHLRAGHTPTQLAPPVLFLTLSAAGMMARILSL